MAAANEQVEPEDLLPSPKEPGHAGHGPGYGSGVPRRHRTRWTSRTTRDPRRRPRGGGVDRPGTPCAGLAGRHPRGGTAPARRPCRPRGAGRPRGDVAWRVMLLSRDDAESLLRALVARANLPQPGAAGGRPGSRSSPIARRPRWMRPGCSPRCGGCSRPASVASSSARTRRYLRELFAWGLQAELTRALDRLAKPTGEIDRRPAVGRRPPRPAARARHVDRGRGAARPAGRHPVRRAAAGDGRSPGRHRRGGRLPRRGRRGGRGDAGTGACGPRWRRCRSRR